MIELKGLSCGYGKKEIVRNVDSIFEKNRINIILGPNGCGKTTLLKAIAGLVTITSGIIKINGKNVQNYKKNEMARLLAFMPQMRHVPDMSVSSFLMCARYPYLGMNKAPGKADYAAMEEAMEITGIREYENRLLKRLSGGERQKVYFAFMLAQQAEIMLLDEPTTYLDVLRQFEVLDLIKSMKDNGKTIIMVMHDISHSLKYADNIMVMNEGRSVAIGAAMDIYEQRVIEKIYNVKIHKQNISGHDEFLVMK